MSIRTILVDDERLAIQGLELRLAAFPDVEIVERCANGREAIRAIKTLKPDLVFLDIQMPGFDGFSVVSGLADIEPPLFVFVTAYSEHALKAFEAQLEGKSFFRSNSGYLVNLRHVLGVQGSSSLMVGGHDLLISRSRKKAFLAALTDYLGARTQ